MSPTPYPLATSRTVIGRARGGRPRTYRLTRPERGRSVTTACRQLARAFIGELPGVWAGRLADATRQLAPAA